MSRAALCVALLCVGVSGAAAQSGEGPLSRRITMHVREIALRDALDRVAALAHFRLSYSSENLPLDRRVSVSRDTSPVSSVLGDLLREFPVQPVVVGDDHVVLTPRATDAGDTASRSVAVLDRVVVTGSVAGAAQRPLPIALDVIPGRDIERRDETALSQVFDGSVPGMWLWQQSPSSMLARYGSIRGASSFGLSFPKVYIDGIEVANPLLLTQITPEIVERVEVIRGPQGAALYGSDAISGVVNIVSRHEGARPDGSHALVRSEAGYTLTAYSPTAVPVQEHALTIRGGSNLRSGGISVGVSTSGDYIPEAYSRELRTVADVRVIGARSTLTAGARFYGKNAGVPASPLLVALKPERFQADSEPQLLRMYSIGSTLTLAPTERWTYALTAGLDGYSLRNVSNELAAIPSVADTALRDASGAANRATLRASAVTNVGAPQRVGATFTLATERSLLQDRTLGVLPPPESSGKGSSEFQNYQMGWSTNTGVSAQTNLVVREFAYLTAGMRLERISQPRRPSQVEALPMIGGALVRDFERVTAKLRAAYGRGIRAPHSTMHVATAEPRKTVGNPDLAPEEQSGTEAGVDLFFGRIFGLHATRFDQRASGLIQMVTIGDTTITSSSGSGPGRDNYWFQLQNVGEITNRGWETQASLTTGRLALGAAATFVDSRVQRLARGYSGDLRRGDRMLAVPARTLSGTASWIGRRVQLSSTLSRASDWINYDRLAIAEAWIAARGDARILTGDRLRTFWMSYPGATRLRSAMSLDVSHGLLFTATGENLLNYQRGEPDSITIVPGRTITLGVRARF